VRIAPTASVVVGESVYAIGTPRGLELTMSAGLVSSLRKNTAGQIVLVQTSASVSGGSSGGGLFDDSGALVGLTTLGSVTGDAQNLNFAIPADWIVELPDRHARLNRKAKRADDAASAAVAGASR
jgi:S1-C subfamily serine protease